MLEAACLAFVFVRHGTMLLTRFVAPVNMDGVPGSWSRVARWRSW
jgi:hypothetical protein